MWVPILSQRKRQPSVLALQARRKRIKQQHVMQRNKHKVQEGNETGRAKTTYDIFLFRVDMPIFSASFFFPLFLSHIHAHLRFCRNKTNKPANTAAPTPTPTNSIASCDSGHPSPHTFFPPFTSATPPSFPPSVSPSSRLPSGLRRRPRSAATILRQMGW